MSDLPSTNAKIQTEETTYRSPVSETLLQRVGSSINYALDGVASNASSISSVSGTVSALTTELNSSAQCWKSEAYGSASVVTIGNNSVYTAGQLIDSDTINIQGSATGWVFVYFAAQRHETNRGTSAISITLLNEPAFGSQVLDNACPEIGFNRNFLLIPAATTYQIKIDLYAVGGATSNRNRWDYYYQTVRVNPSDYIIP